nr:MAG TPA: hypothetical protein [Caudoviricetes sp.]
MFIALKSTITIYVKQIDWLDDTLLSEVSSSLFMVLLNLHEKHLFHYL